MEIFCQIDYKGFFIGLTANDFEGAIDTVEPIFDKSTEKAKWDGSKWVIKSIIEWEKEAKEVLELQKIENEKQLIIQKEIDESKKITDFYEMASILGMI